MSNLNRHLLDSETIGRLLSNLWRTHLEMQECNLEIEYIDAQLAESNRQYRLQRVRRSLKKSA
jgi:hypothetical protein